MNWSKQQSFDFDRTHEYNIKCLEKVIMTLSYLWLNAGKPMDEKIDRDKYPELFHFHVYLSGLTERITKILKGEN